MIAADIMTRDVVTVGPDTAVTEIARLLLEKRISAVPVVEDGRPIGIVSEGDLLRQVSPAAPRQPNWLELVFSRDTLAAEYVHDHARIARQIMSRPVVTVLEDALVPEIVDLLESKRIKRVPVVDLGGKVVGVISRSNLLQGLAARARQQPPPSSAEEDRRIRNAYLAEIGSQGWADFPEAGNVIVEGGVMHLYGLARSPDVRKAMLVAAQNIQGVRKVEDHMHDSAATDPMRWGWPEPPRP
jgi:CBS domain-containing protein